MAVVPYGAMAGAAQFRQANNCGVGQAAASAAPTALQNEPLQHVAYLHDGTLEGLLCCVFAAYERHEDPEDIVCDRSYQPRFEQSAIFVPTEFERAQRVRRGVQRQAGVQVFGAIVRAAANDDPSSGMAVLRFIRHVMQLPAGAKGNRFVLNDLANPAVANLVPLERRVCNEEEKTRQFVRFSHLENDVWFARCNPNANVVPLVMGHFAVRFNTQPFIIYDENHHLAGVYDGNDWSIVADDVVNIPGRAADDEYIELLWRRFYDSLSIEARYNPELRRHFMPVRLWKNLPELR